MIEAGKSSDAFVQYIMPTQIDVLGGSTEEHNFEGTSFNLMMVYWLYNRTGDEFLLELGELIYEQTFDWTGVFGVGEIAKLNPVSELYTVNLAMGLKEPVSKEIPITLSLIS